MNTFKKIPESGDQPLKSKPSIGQIFLFNSYPVIRKNDIENSISSIEPLKTKVKVDIQVQTTEALLAFVEFDRHQLQLVGLRAPVPAKVLENTIQPSNWGQDVKATMRNHQSHVLCYYHGNNSDPIEQMISMYKMAYSLYNKGIVGILDEDAWNCMPRFMINE